MVERGGGRVRSVLRLLLFLYPASFRESLGADLVETMVARWRDAKVASSIASVSAFWLVEVPRFGVDGLFERVRGWFIGAADVRNALRQVKRAPGFHGLAMVAIALGIGATTTIVAVTDAVVFRPLPFEGAGDLYLIRSRFGELTFGSNSLPNMRDVAEAVGQLDWIAGAYDWSPALTGEGEPVRAFALSVTRDYLPGLGARARIGRLFVAGDHEAGAPAVAVVSWGQWQRRWGGDPEVLGRTIRLDGRPYTLVGVMDRSFRDPEPIESGVSSSVWLPVQDGDTALERRTNYAFQLIGRVRAGTATEDLERDLVAFGHRLTAAYPDNSVDGDSLEFQPVRLKDETIAESRERMLLMLGAVLLLLLLSCANVANLFFARGNSRRSELSVRAALGASRMRIARQLFMESLVTTALGGAAGVVLGAAGLRAFIALAPAELPRMHEATLDFRVLGLVVAITLLAAILSGLAPAMRTAASGIVFRESRSTAGRSRLRLQAGLVSAEIALALILLTGSVLLLRSFSALLLVDPGFDAGDLVVAEIRPPGSIDAAGQRSFYREVLDRVSSLPGVLSASLLYTAPGAGGGAWTRISPEDADPAGPVAPFTRITPIMGDAFETLRVELRAGRTFGDVRAGDPRVVILNESAAREVFPGVGDPVGRRLRFGTAGSDQPLREVVGLVRDISQRGPGDEPEAQVYLPAVQGTAPRYSLVLRMSAGMAPPAAAIRAIADEAGSVPVDRIDTMDELFAASTAGSRFLAMLLSTFAFLALVLAAVGTYGTASYAVGRRLGEAGIRLALGAASTSIFGLFLRNAAATVAVGIAAGAAGGFVLSRFLEGYVFGVTARDPFSFAAAGALIATSALLASLVPALRAARVDPNRVLRMDG